MGSNSPGDGRDVEHHQVMVDRPNGADSLGLVVDKGIIMNPGGGPTADKPDVTLKPPGDPHTTSAFLNIRVADIEACYRDWSARGAEFLTPPIDRKAELRCYLRDPDGHLIEVGQATGMLEGVFADPPAGTA
ncbi:VOC family protein [Streptomyces sp. NPDC021019]|uniref:VOC family protein n=1 Tax=Streptomyces sp. NPDC021019 TaxID=3365108 RepID=UPI00378CCD79